MGDLKVIGVGFPRTGTSSLKIALERLGFRCYHMFELHKHSTHPSLWLQVFDEKENRQQLFEKIFHDYQATVDFPSAIFYEDQLRYYPNAKFILTLRNTLTWYESFRDTIVKLTRSLPNLVFIRISSPTFYKMIRKIDESQFHGKMSKPKEAIEAYEQHNARVLKCIPAEKLLIYRVEEGWAPLCDFLNLPVPDDQPFPKDNERQKMLERINKSSRLGWIYIFAFAGFFLCIVWFLFC